MRITVLMGGSSAEREISLATGEAVVRRCALLDHEVLSLDPKDPLAAVQSEEIRAAELVFVALHGGSGEDGRIQALLELAGKLYVGSGPTACAVSMDKLLSKHLMRSLGVPTPSVAQSFAAGLRWKRCWRAPGNWVFPLVFKPVSEGSAIGVAIDPSEDRLREIWRECSASTGRWMLERYIPGRELTLPMVAGRCTPLVEILPKEGFYDYQNKYTPGRTEYRCPAELEAKVEEELREMGLRLWNALNLQDMARMDLRLDENSRFWFLEINTIPGMTKTSLLPMGAQEIGLNFAALCETLCAGPFGACASGSGRKVLKLQIYNHANQKKEEFQPLDPPRVTMYVCGMTVQDRPHMGHMLAFVSADLIRRSLEFLGYEVLHVQNFTDIDDKIIARANERGEDPAVLAQENIDRFFAAADALGIKRAHIYPKVTEHIQDIQNYIARLIEAGHAYEAGGSVWFDVRSWSSYGELSGRRIEDLESGYRIEVDANKRDPLDFALWKASKEGEPAWESPWGRGRPGWHIECSVMSTKYLGESFDLHGGGRDLIFPHHENEVAQSKALGSAFVHYWMHNGLLNLQGQKMSKSTGHFFAMDEVLEEFAPEVVRFYLLRGHFRNQMEYGRERMLEAKAAYGRMERALSKLEELHAREDLGRALEGRHQEQGRSRAGRSGRSREGGLSGRDLRRFQRRTRAGRPLRTRPPVEYLSQREALAPGSRGRPAAGSTRVRCAIPWRFWASSSSSRPRRRSRPSSPRWCDAAMRRGAKRTGRWPTPYATRSRLGGTTSRTDRREARCGGRVEARESD